MSDHLETRIEEEVSAGVVVGPAVPERRAEVAPETRSAEAEPKRTEQPAFTKGIVREYFESAVVTLIMALFGMTFIVQAVKVPTGSMKNTIAIQDHLLVNKFIFGSRDALHLPLLPEREIRRGDVVVFKYPENPDVNFVKRVIGLPGETVEYSAKDNKVFINGQELPEHRAYVERQMNEDPTPLRTISDAGAAPADKWTVFYYDDDRDSAAGAFNNESGRFAVRQPFRIPKKGEQVPETIESDPKLAEIYDADHDGKYDADQYFCMGDNRDNSLDSRFWGTVPRNSMVGRAMIVYWSIDRAESPDDKDKSNPIVDFFTKTRWSRTGKFIK